MLCLPKEEGKGSLKGHATLLATIFYLSQLTDAPQCDGKRPTCSPCKVRNLGCIYPLPKQMESPEGGALRKAGEEARSIVELLRSVPYDEAVELLQKLRGGSPPTPAATPSTTVVRKPPSIPPPIPAHFYVRSVIPPTRNNLEFELVVRHPIAYPTLLPIPIESLPIDVLLHPSQIRRLQVPSISLPSPQGVITPAALDMRHDRSKSPSLALEAAIVRPLIDNRLLDVDITYWTNVPISVDLAARVISLYLEIDYPVLPLFNAELFLEDFLQGRPNFCSHFLVSALLSWACVS